ncbi:GNAT family N-acetyltransferase [Nonomuraea sp. NPDC048892]|uniref:GNAT family N-acetyltransferase n=1 Tax=Nonomuraea sp. NPDC048892 TaxID=3154624 RepID=UPI00340A0025
MRIQPIAIADRPGPTGARRPEDDLVAGLYAAHTAASTDVPGPELSLARFRRDVCAHAPSARAEAWALVDGDGDGKVAGGYALSLPQSDNRHMGSIFPLAVRPEHRGRGLGSMLFGHALDRMRAHGRSLLLTVTPVAGTGTRFARAHGMTVALAEARRVLDLRDADWAALRAMYPPVEGYSLESWVGPATPELLPDLSAVKAGMNDAPRDSGVGAIDYGIDLVRAYEERIPYADETCYTTIARRDRDGAPAGYTRIFVPTDRAGGWAEQGDTAVLSEHRGHRLGLALKLANLFLMRANEPAIDRVITWNATSNAHMVAINEAMGFVLFDEWTGWRLSL